MSENLNPLDHYLNGYEHGIHMPSAEELDEWASFVMPTPEEVEQIEREIEEWDANMTDEERQRLEEQARIYDPLHKKFIEGLLDGFRARLKKDHE